MIGPHELEAGHVNERGQPYNAQSIRAMLSGRRNATGRPESHPGAPAVSPLIQGPTKLASWPCGRGDDFAEWMKVS